MPTSVSQASPAAARDDSAFSLLPRLAQVTAGLTLAVGAIVVLGPFAPGRNPAPAAPTPAAEAATRPAARPALPLALTAPRFHLDDPDALEPVRAEAGRHHPASGQREDVLVQGTFDGIDMSYLRLTLTETPRAEAEPSLFVTLARRAADGPGLAVIRAGERGVVETKFGAVETLEITLGGEGKRICTGFISRMPGPVRLDGWLCAPLGQAPTVRAVVCTLDKVGLNGQAWPDGEGAFAAFERRRDPSCGAAIVADREAGGETGSIANPRARKNEAKLRPSRQARP